MWMCRGRDESGPLFFFFFWRFFVLESRLAKIDSMGARPNERNPGEMCERGQHQEAHDAFENIDPCAVLRKYMDRHADQQDQENAPGNYVETSVGHKGSSARVARWIVPE